MANTGLQTNLNVSPYYDDFNESKNFHRILFKPSIAVQARELTQLQTIVQNQIDRFGKHIFTEGSVVLGGKPSVNTSYDYVKISDKDILNNTISLSSFVGQKITGQTSGVTATVIGYESGLVASSPNTNTLYVSYTNSGTSGTTKTFNSNEILVTNTTNVSVTSLNIVNTIGKGSIFTIEAGVIFSKGHFIRFDSQAIILEKYSTTPTHDVGFIIAEEIVDSVTDSTLLDPANGSYNYAAPGAARLKLTATLAIVNDNTDTNAPNFVKMLSIKDGVIESLVEKTQYSLIRDELARRTYDESGNYVVNGLGVRIREHLNDSENNGLYSVAEGGDSSLLAVGVESGLAYVFGYDIEKLSTTYVPIEKSTDFKVVDGQNITANYGNYVFANQVIGSWNVNVGKQITLYNTAQARISDRENADTAVTGSAVGTAKFKSIEYYSGEPGTANAVYKIYLYDVVMTTGTFGAVRSLYSAETTANCVADIVLDAGVSSLNEITFSTSIYEIPSKNIRKIRDASNNVNAAFTFVKTFPVTIPTAGSFTINTGTTSETFAYGTGALNSDQKAEFVLSLNGTATVTGTGTVTVTSGSPTLTGSGTTFSTKFIAGDKILIGSTSEVYIIQTVNSNTSLTLTTNVTTASAGSAYKKQYYKGDILGLNRIGFSGTSRTATVSSSTSVVFDIKETLDSSVTASVICPLTKVDAKEIKKTLRTGRYVIIDTSSNAGGTTGPWDLGLSDVIQITSVRKKSTSFSTLTDGTDVTSGFTLDNGQRDNHYDHGRLINAGTSISAGDKILVQLDYYAHDFSQGAGYFSVDSYPVDDVNGAANTSAITTEEIPFFVSPINGKEYNLRDCVDTRPSKVNTATDATVLGSVSTNPAITSSFNSSLGVLYTPKVNENFVFSLSYYLSRKDMIFMDTSGSVGRVRGKPDILPITPEEPNSVMPIAVVTVAPFPSLPSDIAKAKNRQIYENKIKALSIKRYTMKDISVLDGRISNLEYYTTLSFLEKDTLDTKVLDSNGLDRFKNGIFVDPFNNHSLGDLTDPGYKIAVDKDKSELRPFFDVSSVRMKNYSLTNTVLTGNVITLPFTHELFAQQQVASSTRNAAGYFYNYKGEMVLNPESDIWVDTTIAPDLYIKDESSEANYTNWQKLSSAWGSDWNSWQKVWTSTSNITTTATTSKINVTSTVNNQNYGTRVIDSSIVPYMRSIPIKVTCFGLKPNTKIYAWFDGEDVKDYITPYNSAFTVAGTQGTTVSTDSSGHAYFVFNVPNDSVLKFRTGTKVLRVTDSITNTVSFGSFTTSAEGQFTASGFNQTKQSTIVSVTVPQISISTTSVQVINNTTPAAILNSGNTDHSHGAPAGSHGPDPIAQSFIIPSNRLLGADGAFITKLDLYFQSKDTNNGVFVEIREMSTDGNITPRIIPNSRINVPVSAINTSNDSSVVTQVSFPSPIYLKADTYYAFVIKPIGNNSNTIVWSAILGESDILTGAKINSQPTSGSLYVSSDQSIWNAVQNEDLKFNIYVANFSTTSGSVVLTNSDCEFITANTFSGAVTVGENVKGEDRLTFTTIVGGSIANSQTAVGTTSGTIGIVDNISGSVYRVNNTTSGSFVAGENVNFKYANGTLTGTSAAIDTVTAPTGIISYQKDNTVELESTTNTFAVGEKVLGLTSNTSFIINSINNKKVNVIDPEVGFITPLYTGTTWGVKTTNALNVTDSSFSEININDNNYLNFEKAIFSKSNESASLSGTKSFQLQGTLNTSNMYVSPFIDQTRIHTMVVSNTINNDATGENQATHGNALTRYVSQKITLDEGQDAEDISAFVTGYRPPGADIKVYFKALHSEDSDLFSEKLWTEMVLNSGNFYSDRENKEDFKDYEYGISTSILTGPQGQYQYVNSKGITFTGFKYYAFKIVLLGVDTAAVPRLKDFRSIALQK